MLLAHLNHVFPFRYAHTLELLISATLFRALILFLQPNNNTYSSSVTYYSIEHCHVIQLHTFPYSLPYYSLWYCPICPSTQIKVLLHFQVLSYLLYCNTTTHYPVPCHIKVLLHFQVLNYVLLQNHAHSSILPYYSIITFPGTTLSISTQYTCTHSSTRHITVLLNRWVPTIRYRAILQYQVLSYLLSFTTTTHIPVPCHVTALLPFQVLTYLLQYNHTRSGTLQYHRIITLPGTNLST